MLCVESTAFSYGRLNYKYLQFRKSDIRYNKGNNI